MAVTTIKWNGDAFKDLTERRIRIALQITGRRMATLVKKSISERGAVKGKRKRGQGGRFLKQKRGRSIPGDPPFVDTGRLRTSIISEQSGDAVRVGTNVEYARALELGTRVMAKRPYLRPALDRAGPIVKAAINSASKR